MKQKYFLILLEYWIKSMPKFCENTELIWKVNLEEEKNSSPLNSLVLKWQLGEKNFLN